MYRVNISFKHILTLNDGYLSVNLKAIKQIKNDFKGLVLNY